MLQIVFSVSFAYGWQLLSRGRTCLFQSLVIHFLPSLLDHSYSILSHLFFPVFLPGPLFKCLVCFFFIYHHLHNKCKAHLFLSYQLSGCKGYKCHQVRPILNTSTSKLKYILICTHLKIKKPKILIKERHIMLQSPILLVHQLFIYPTTHHITLSFILKHPKIPTIFITSSDKLLPYLVMIIANILLIHFLS